MEVRSKLYHLVEHDYDKGFSASKAYDMLMLAAIVLGVFPLMFKTPYPIFRYFESAACAAFIFDYLAKWITADFRFGGRGILAFIRYPFSPWAVLDMLTILPGLNLLGKAFVTLRIARLLKNCPGAAPFGTFAANRTAGRSAQARKQGAVVCTADLPVLHLHDGAHHVQHRKHVR